MLIEAITAEGTKGSRWRIRVIRAGLSGNRNFYPADVLKKTVPLFEGTRVFVKSDAEHLTGGGKDVRNLIGRLASPAFIGSGASADGEIQATLELIEPDGAIAQKMREAFARGMTDLFGFSIDATGATKPDRMNGQSVKVATAISAVNSVDLIVEPAAGGQIINLIEGQTNMELTALSQTIIADIVCASGLPSAVQTQLIKDHPASAGVTEEALRESIARTKAIAAHFTESGKVMMGDFDPVDRNLGQSDKVTEILDAFFDPEHKDHRHARSFRECYVTITGDKNITGMLGNSGHALLRESLLAGSWANVLGNAITRRMVNEYRRPTQYDLWRQIATIAPVQDFRVNERTRVGGYGDLPIVGESGPYTAVASPTDEKATYQIQKRGGTEDITLEMIANDDVGAIQRIPIRLAGAAKRTLSKFVFDLLRTNPVIYDGLVLFHATHNNLGAAALDATSLAARRLAMKRQTELSSGDRLGIGPRYLIVPDDLQETAVNLFNRNTNNDKTFIQAMTLEVLPIWYWTDSNDWFLAADPADIPCIEVGFFNGQQEPELFVQDNPTVGSMFTNDKLTYKIRYIYGATVTDFRGLDRSVV
ncbi:hypothetical protein [Hypericibacter sp.]|uniref:phage major capsid protein n=1 Tax=Hypericibacter sp. TaxID=2705401 RepID=UPI003D6CB3CE